MSGLRSWIVLTVCAAAVGGLAGAVVVALRDPAPVVRVDGRGAADPEREGAGSVPASPDTTTDAASGGTSSAEVRRGLTARLDAPDAAERHAVALELLRRGPSALAQARALRPTSDEGIALHERLVLALDKMRLLRRANDYAKLPEHLRLRLDLDAFASVVPESLLLGERIAYWQRELESTRLRRESGYADPAEEALASLELALARREAGEIAAGAYSAEAAAALPEIEAWVARRREQAGVAPAEIADLEAQLARLRD